MLNINQEDIELFKKFIRKTVNFPVENSIYYNIYPILFEVEIRNKFFKMANCLINQYIIENNKDLDAIVGIETQGFLLGSVLADHLKIPFIPIRYDRKLPGKVIYNEFSINSDKKLISVQTEYIDKNFNVIIVDDVLIKGDLLENVQSLVTSAGCRVIAFFVMVEIIPYNKRKILSSPVISVVKINDL